jgi:hypothetical protein
MLPEEPVLPVFPGVPGFPVVPVFPPAPVLPGLPELPVSPTLPVIVLLFLINAKVPALQPVPTSNAGVDGELEVTPALINVRIFSG